MIIVHISGRCNQFGDWKAFSRYLISQYEQYTISLTLYPHSLLQCNVRAFHIHGSVHPNSILIRSNKMQQYAGIYLLQNYSHVSGVHRTHYQEYIKL